MKDNQNGRQNGRCLLVCICVWCRGHSYSVVLIGCLPNLKYGLLPSNSCSSCSSCTTNDNQDGRQNGGHLSVCTCELCCGHSNSVIFNQISFKLDICIASINLSFKLEYGTITKLADETAAAYQFCSCGHSTLVIYYLSASIFHNQALTQLQIWVLFDNQDDR